MNTAVENMFYIFATNGTYKKLARGKITNLCTYVIDAEREVVIYSTVEWEGNKFSTTNQTCTKAVRELQVVLASPSDYDLANAVENNVVYSLLSLGGASKF